MKLFRTVCTTDWKCRPNHGMFLVATSDVDAAGRPFPDNEIRETLIEAMDNDIYRWMALDIAADEYNALVSHDDPDNDPEDGWDVRRAEELLDPALDRDELEKRLLPMWENVSDSRNRFEMELRTGEIARSFVDKNNDGDRCTIVYHFLNDDGTYVSRG